ncbi:hypothetical protein LFT45_19745 [Arthrobacter sp. FW305-BF8]|uniref:hypothetical protein n=1 Tax=Arthrobacter sp. FW305-BF8 TaxID=2879617 RepID=UPI001F4194A2|nr:hypothetical protein [Arthrobacter sp. FW305-BF8]UKA53914.1 hypothetical protein LFT45_19745 [Arthrobacter sp. FW305-BF8]
MQKLQHTINAVFVISLALLLIAGIVFVAGQALALITGHGDWLAVLNEAVKGPACIAASVCAIAGFLLSYKKPAKQNSPQQEARTQ